jgi:hypothetical protein
MVKRTQRKTNQRKTLRKTKQRKTQRKTKQRKTQRKTKQRKTQRKTKQRKTQKRKTYKLKGGDREYILGYFITEKGLSEFQVVYNLDTEKIVINSLQSKHSTTVDIIDFDFTKDDFTKDDLNLGGRAVYKYNNFPVLDTNILFISAEAVNDPETLYNNIVELKSNQLYGIPVDNSILGNFNTSQRQAELLKTATPNNNKPSQKQINLLNPAIPNNDDLEGEEDV